MHGINLRKIVRRWHWHKHPSSARPSDATAKFSAARIWHRHHHHHHNHRCHWDTFASDSEDDCSDWAPQDVPAGCLVVYVGTEKHRYVIDAHYLSHPLFKALLQRSAEEYGFHHEGGLTMACEVLMFEHLLRLVENHDSRTRYADLEEMMDFYASSSPSDTLSRPLL